MNDSISKALCSISYASIDKAVAMAQAFGRGLLANLDLKETYRAVPVHSSDQCLLAVHWEEATYIDMELPFLPLRTEAVFGTHRCHDVVPSRMRCRCSPTLTGRLLAAGPPGSAVYAQSLLTTLALCDELGFLVTPEKTEGLTTVLTFLGSKWTCLARYCASMTTGEKDSWLRFSSGQMKR